MPSNSTPAYPAFTELRSRRKGLLLLFSALVIIGIIAFFIGMSGSHPERAWECYLINFVFWTGLTAGCVLFSAAMVMTEAKWGRPLKRLAEAPGAFLPVAFILFWAIYFGRESIFKWLHEPVPAKAAWLNEGFLFARDGIALFVLAAVCLALIYHSIQGDLKALSRGQGSDPAGEVSARHYKAQTILSPIYGILYAFILSLVAFDLVMSLEPEWYSTLFGAYYFIGSFYTGLAFLFLLALAAVRSPGIGDYIKPKQFHDLGKLMLGFCLMTADFFYTQYLIIWYGNLPDETRFVIQRVREQPWNTIAWTVLFVCFAVPFVVLLNRKVKMKAVPMFILSSLIILGMWLNGFLLVAPSIWKGKGLPLGVYEVCITAGFFGLVALCVTLFLGRYPWIPLSDPYLVKKT